jgi:exopolysaccharide production protein ExoQ
LKFSARTGLDWKSAADAVVAVLGLLWLTGVFQSSLPRHLARNHIWIGWGIELLRLGVWVAPIALLLFDPRRLGAAARSIWPILLIAVLAAASTLWSIRPDATLRGSAILATTTGFGVFFGLRFENRSQLYWIGTALAIVAVGSIAAVLVFPDHGLMQEGSHRGLWMGLYRHKNLLARDMALAVPVFALLARGRIVQPALAWGLAAIGIGLIVASGSRTGGVVVAVATATALSLARSSGNPRMRPALLIAASAAFCAMLAWSLPAILGAVDRDATLSGRTQLWSAVAEKIGERPWLGYGYDAFWVRSVSPGEPAAEVAEQIDWVARHAHNGFLDVMLDLGWIGLAVFAIPLFVYATRIVRDLRSGVREAAGAWPAVFLVYWILSNLTESPLLRHDHLGWALYVTVIVGAARAAPRNDPASG